MSRAVWELGLEESSEGRCLPGRMGKGEMDIGNQYEKFFRPNLTRAEKTSQKPLNFYEGRRRTPQVNSERGPKQG